MASSSGKTELAAEIASRLELYKGRRPYQAGRCWAFALKLVRVRFAGEGVASS